MLSLLFTAALATAAPLQATRQKTPNDYPPRIYGDAFTLIANVTSATTAANPPINHWALTVERIGATQYAAVLAPSASVVLFLNGTTSDISAENTAIYAPPLDTGIRPVPLGMQFRTTSGSGLGTVGISYGYGDTGAGIGIGLRDPYARLFAPAGLHADTFVVCKQENPAYGRPEYPVLFHQGTSALPENCVAVALLAQCAPLPRLVGEKELNLVRPGVGCYEDVKAIDWSKW